MRPVIQQCLLVGILGCSIIGLTGCGEKRIHVATVSGAPGEEQDSSTSEGLDSLPSDHTGLPGNNVAESSLSGENSSSEEVRADAVLPVAPVEPLNFAHEPSKPDYADDPARQEPAFPSGAGPEPESDAEPESDTELTGDTGAQDSLANGNSIASQSGSSSSNGESPDQAEPVPFSTPADLFNTQGDGDFNSGAGQMAATEPFGGFQDDFSNSGNNTSDPSSDMFHNDPLNPQIVEEIPEKVQMAKAEPSDILRQQLDKIKEEELATVSAGLEDVFFLFDSWTLTEEAKESLERDMGRLSKDPSSSLIIEGHADQRGTQAYNMVLGKKRATAIRDYLSQLGVDPSRLTVISYGKDKPFCQDSTEVCHQLNRRGHLVVHN